MRALLETAFDAGIAHYDTAPLYGWGEAELVFGEFAQGRRDQVALVTKAGMAPPTLAQRIVNKALGREARPQTGLFQPAQVRRSLEKSLRALRTDHVDALLLHEITPQQMSEETGEELLKLKREGKALKVGLATSAAASDRLLSAFPNLFDIVQAPAGAIVRNLGNAMLITHSVFGPRLEKARAALQGDREQAAELLLRAAMALNPNGVTLFSSTRPETIRKNARLKSADPGTVSAVTRLLLQA